MVNARIIVEPPGRVPLPYGLASVVDWREANDPHWKNGITWQTLCGGGGTTYDPCSVVTGTGGEAGPAPAKADNIDRDVRGATPFTVIAELDCSPPGHWDESESLIRAALLQVEPWQVEQAFWTGIAAGQEAVFPHLAADAVVTDPGNFEVITLQQAATVVTGSAVDVVEALGMLENALGDCLTSQQGVIHVAADLLAHLDAWNLVKKDGVRLRTCAGNLVAVGQGYAGTAPDGSTPPVGRTWMYATGPVFGYRGDIRIINGVEALDRSVNTLKSIAERTYVLAYDCCLFAIQTSTGGVASGTPGTT